jgi:hypothetical protein
MSSGCSQHSISIPWGAYAICYGSCIRICCCLATSCDPTPCAPEQMRTHIHMYIYIYIYAGVSCVGIQLKASPLPRAPLEVKRLRRSEDQRIRRCCHLGPSWAVLGPSWDMLGCLGAMLGPSWAVLRPSWGYLGSIFGHIGVIMGHLGVMLVILGLSWAILGSTWPSWGSILGCHLSGFGGPTRLGGPGGQLGHLGVPSWPIWKTSHTFWGVRACF